MQSTFHTLPDLKGEDMPKRKEPELTPAEQSKRFKEAAKKAGVTNQEDEFEGAFRSVAHRPGQSARPPSRRSGK